MKQRTTQLGVRKNPDSSRVHGLRVSANWSPALSSERKQLQFKRDAGFERLLDGTEAASLLRIHPKTLQKLARIGCIPAYRVGRFWRYRASDLEMWLRSDANSDRQLADCVDFTKEKNQ